MRTLHDLTRAEGVDHVAELLAVTPRALVDYRRGHTAITVDELHALGEAFPDFDLGATVRQLGAERERRGVSKRARRRAGSESSSESSSTPR